MEMTITNQIFVGEIIVFARKSIQFGVTYGHRRTKSARSLFTGHHSLQMTPATDYQRLSSPVSSEFYRTSSTNTTTFISQPSTLSVFANDPFHIKKHEKHWLSGDKYVWWLTNPFTCFSFTPTLKRWLQLRVPPYLSKHTNNRTGVLTFTPGRTDFWPKSTKWFKRILTSESRFHCPNYQRDYEFQRSWPRTNICPFHGSLELRNTRYERSP